MVLQSYWVDNFCSWHPPRDQASRLLRLRPFPRYQKPKNRPKHQATWRQESKVNPAVIGRIDATALFSPELQPHTSPGRRIDVNVRMDHGDGGLMGGLTTDTNDPSPIIKFKHCLRIPYPVLVNLETFELSNLPCRPYP